MIRQTNRQCNWLTQAKNFRQEYAEQAEDYTCNDDREEYALPAHGIGAVRIESRF